MDSARTWSMLSEFAGYRRQEFQLTLRLGKAIARLGFDVEVDLVPSLSRALNVDTSACCASLI